MNQYTPVNYSTITPGHMNKSDFMSNYFSQ
jgi:hypothetical protein